MPSRHRNPATAKQIYQQRAIESKPLPPKRQKFWALTESYSARHYSQQYLRSFLDVWMSLDSKWRRVPTKSPYFFWLYMHVHNKPAKIGVHINHQDPERIDHIRVRYLDN